MISRGPYGRISELIQGIRVQEKKCGWDSEAFLWKKNRNNVQTWFDLWVSEQVMVERLE